MTEKYHVMKRRVAPATENPPWEITKTLDDPVAALELSNALETDTIETQVCAASALRRRRANDG